MHAVTLMGAIDHLRSTTQLPVWDDLQVIIRHAKEEVHHAMDEEIYTKAWNEGAALTLDGVVEYAMVEEVGEVKTGLVPV